LSDTTHTPVELRVNTVQVAFEALTPRVAKILNLAQNCISFGRKSHLERRKT
jgi:hypothetical protein